MRRLTNEELHVVKSLAFLSCLVPLAIWNWGHPVRLLVWPLVFLFVFVAPMFVHRFLTHRILKKAGFRLVCFHDQRGAFRNPSYDWPWWKEFYDYEIAITSDTLEETWCYVKLLGPVFATIRPRIRFSVWFDADAPCEELVTDLKALVLLQPIDDLRFFNSMISDTELEYVACFHQLEYLHLQRTAITDDGLRHLRSLKILKELYLDETKITDRGLSSLEPLTNLTFVNLRDTQATAEGRALLGQKLPKCNVHPDP